MTDPPASGAVAAAIARHLPDGLRHRRRPDARPRPAALLCSACRTPLAPHLSGLGVHLFCTDPTTA